MPESTKKSRPPMAILEEARSLVSSVTQEKHTSLSASTFEKESTQKRSGGPNENDNAGGNLLLHCATLVEDFHQLSLAEFKFEFKDWTVVKAVMELLIRRGIYPYLSPGVGIPLQKRFGEKAVAAAAAAVSDHLRHDASTFKASGPLWLDTIDGPVETHPLVLSAQLLSSLALESSGGDLPATSSGTQGDPNYNSSKVTEKENTLHGSSSPEEEDDPGFSSPAMALHQLVLSHHLVDVLAALLQCSYGALLISTSLDSPETWKESATESINLMVEKLPVAHLVEALFILLGEAEGLKPPLWLKPEVGKLLSLVLMRDGGVAAVMERLVGRADKGNVHVYERVAAQLAKVPRSIASKDQYYKEVCMQLQPLLVLPLSHSKFGSSSDIASRLLDNMHHTSILLACTLAHQDPALAERYLSQPIVEPLLNWGALQPQGQIASTETAQDKVLIEVLGKRATAISERSVVNSLLTVQVLLTSGHKGSLHLRQQLLKLTLPIASELMLLNYLSWPLFAKHDSQDLEETVKRVSIGQGEIFKEAYHWRQKLEKGVPQKDFARGFLMDRSLSTSLRSGGELEGDVGQFVSAVSDIVLAHLSEISQAPSIVYSFLFSHDTTLLEWPTVDGEIADALKAGREQPDSAVFFLAKLLLRSENWQLTLALLSALVNNVLKLRQMTHRRARFSSYSQSHADIVNPETVLQSLQTLDVIFVEVGLKAVEEDTSGALPVLKALLDDNDLLEDVELLELVLQLVHGAVSRLKRADLHEKGEETLLLHKTELGVVLNSIGTSLEKIQAAAGVTANLKQFVTKIRVIIFDI